MSEIPPSFTYEKYEAHLDSLVEKNVLSSYDDHSSDRVRYVLKFPRAGLADILKRDKMNDVLKMRESEGENLTTLDETGGLRIFESAEEVVRYFVKFRLGFYGKRKERLLSDIGREIDILDAKARFIDAIIHGRIIVANEKKSNIIASIENEGIQKQDDSYDFLIGMPIWSLTQEKYAELQKKLAQKKRERKVVESTSPSDFYKSDLLELRTHVEKSHR